MGGGLLQLVAYGAQDSALTGTPQITFFRSVYRRHTNFAVESIPQTFIGTAGFGKKITASLSRNGDLVNACVLEVKLPSIQNDTGQSLRWVDDVGYHLIKRVEVDIGGQKVDAHTGEWMHLWNQLSQPKSKDGEMDGWGSGHHAMIGNAMKNSAGPKVGDVHESIPATSVYVPLKFWFNSPENPGLALPLLALQYHEVKISIEFNDITKLLVKWDDGYNEGGIDTDNDGAVNGDETSSPVSADGGCHVCHVTSSDFTVLNADCFDAQLFVDYIYLDNEERRRFAQDNHEYLIPQVQYTGEECLGSNCKTERYRMNFNHPVKELVWVVQRSGNEPSDYADGTGNNPVCRAKMMLNGHDRFSEREGTYFDCVQPYMHHTRCPTRGINVYSFALKPEQHQPSGTCNFSRIDNAQLEMRIRDGVGDCSLRVYAVNYNLLRIMSGLGGLAYSN